MIDSQRRHLLRTGGLGLGFAFATPPAWLAGCAATWQPALSAEPLHADAADVAWLNRLTWGIDTASLRTFQSLSRRDYLQSQLHPPAEVALPAAVRTQIDAFGLRQKPMLEWVQEIEERRRIANGIQDDEAKKAAQQDYQQEMSRLSREPALRMLLLALYSPNQLQEQLTWFWFNHFNVYQHKGDLGLMVGDYESALRTHALGRFSDLLIASATHPAMIRYLDNEQNAVNHINENYARELMELHTLGVDAGYSQKDVQELARVLTGLGVNFKDSTPRLKPSLQSLYVRRGATEFNPARHDMSVKTVLGVTVNGRGWNEIIEQLTRLALHPDTARHVSRKLAIYFVADQPPPSLVDRMGTAYLASEGDIAIVLQTMFESPEFSASLGRKFKDSIHYVVSAIRLAYDRYTIVNAVPMLGWLNRLGEGLYNHQTPDGYPMDAAAWSSSGQMSSRFEIAHAIGSSNAGLFETEGSAPVETPAFPQLSNALFHEALAATMSKATRSALDSASSPREWNLLLLSSPEFMVR